MKADSISRRLTALEGDSEQDLVHVRYRWESEDGKVIGPWVEHFVPRSRIKPLENFFEMSEERDRHEEQRREET